MLIIWHNINMKRLLSLSILLFSISFLLTAEESVLFQFKHNKGDAVSHISTVEEEAYINGKLNNRTQFINRTSTTIVKVDEDGSALLNTQYMTTQNSIMNRTGNSLTWGEEATVSIHRTKFGELYDSDNDSLPTVRNIPSFPENPVAAGESWEAPGLEVHDCKELFGMTEAISIPFTAKYTYSGNEIINDTVLQVINVEYEFFQDNTRGKIYRGTNYAGTKGFAKQKIWWDCNKNDIDHFTEQFQIKMVDIYGNVYLFNGISNGEVTEYKSVNDDTNVKKLQSTVEKYKLDNISVRRGEKGLTISVENIQFEADSHRLLPSEKKKLEKIGEILKEFTNDLLITGHCAERGTASARQKLSEERADAVADFLVQNGIRDEYHIFTQGKGSTEPVASNSTEEGRSRNRRVEITIMD